MQIVFQLIYYLLQLPYSIGYLVVLILKPIAALPKLALLLFRKLITSIQTQVAWGVNQIRNIIKWISIQLQNAAAVSSRTVAQLSQTLKNISAIRTKQLPAVTKPAARIHWVMGVVGLVCGLATTATVISYLYLQQLPYPATIAQLAYPRPISIVDTQEVPLFEAFSTSPTYVSPESTPLIIKEAVLRVEDAAAHEWFGIDADASLRGLINLVMHKGLPKPASITQQLARRQVAAEQSNLFSFWQEIWLTVKLEQVYSQDQQLALYLSTMPFGRTVGLHYAAEEYFGVVPSKLSVSQSLYLLSQLNTGSIKLTQLASPPTHETYDRYLNTIVSAGIVSEQHKIKFIEPALAQPQAVRLRAPHAIKSILAEAQHRLPETFSYNQPITIKTTLDLELQNDIQRAVVTQFSSAAHMIPQAAVLVSDPQTGNIKVLTGDSVAADNQEAMLQAAREYQLTASVSSLPLHTIVDIHSNGQAFSLKPPIMLPQNTGLVKAPSNVVATFTNFAIITVWIEPTTNQAQPQLANQIMDNLANLMLSQQQDKKLISNL